MLTLGLHRMKSLLLDITSINGGLIDVHNVISINCLGTTLTTFGVIVLGREDSFNDVILIDLNTYLLIGHSIEVSPISNIFFMDGQLYLLTHGDEELVNAKYLRMYFDRFELMFYPRPLVPMWKVIHESYIRKLLNILNLYARCWYIKQHHVPIDIHIDIKPLQTLLQEVLCNYPIEALHATYNITSNT